ncbi:serine hydrolase domain-containing protein [Nonomuraea sp. NPDC049695]|uniref:serine hydrolase domain-containing protein n=1 Tax=Nonomuraea sp. NPDC049695 TaxID=3154734 RepID=UPI00343A910E
MGDTHASITELLDQGMRERVFPGAVWAIGNSDGVSHWGTCGAADPAVPGSQMRRDTIFDIASLTKIVAVWAVIGSLWEEERLPLDEPLDEFWPEVAGHPIGSVTVQHLLTHTAGLPPRANLRNLYGTDPGAIRAGVLHEELHGSPGRAVEYTDRAALVLGYLAEHVSGRPLDRLAHERVWRPLGMHNTRFGPLPSELAANCAPTELDQDTGTHLKGIAHDFSARLLGGVCGIAGVFSVLDDLALFQRHLLDPTPDSSFGLSWVTESLQVHTGSLTPSRGLFWHPAPGSDDTYIHYGFTGTGMWISPKRQQWAVLLTNKLYYSRDRDQLMVIRDTFRHLVFG